jgi:hypothetical protein
MTRKEFLAFLCGIPLARCVSMEGGFIPMLDMHMPNGKIQRRIIVGYNPNIQNSMFS